MSSAYPKSTLQSLLQYWRNIELFLPFRLEDVFERAPEAIRLRLGETQLLPWEDPASFDLDLGREYAFDVFICPFLLQEIPRVLSAVLPGIKEERPFEPRAYEGSTCFVRFGVTHQGEALQDDFSISTLPWALWRMRERRSLSLHDFELFARDVASRSPNRFSSAASIEDITEAEEESAESSSAKVVEPLTFNDLSLFAQSLTVGHPVDFYPDNLFALIVPYPIRRRKSKSAAPVNKTPDTESNKEALRQKRKVEILNSFFLRDLEKVNAYLQSPERESALLDYLACPLREEQRIDIFHDKQREFVLDLVKVQNCPLARWPAKREQSLSLHQQVALNYYLKAEARLHSVNGPPGTGKTTLVRDLFAHLVFSRARILSTLAKPGDALSSFFIEKQVAKNKLRYRRLRADLKGFELLIASTNNAAVENISLELPLAQSISPEYEGASYLKPIAKLYQALCKENSAHPRLLQDWWGLPSVALGNAANRSRFRFASFFFSKTEEEQETLARLAEGESLDFFEWRQRPTKTAPSFHQAKINFRKLYEQVQVAAGSLPAVELPQPPPSIRSLEWQQSVPGLTAEYNHLRSQLFLAAMQLQESWIRETPLLERELIALSLLLRNPQKIDPEDAAELWPLLFMLIPCVSTTLASVERMFATLPAGTLGHVVIDEAGQATPQAVSGVLLRANRALIIGDQRQLEPVVITPEALERKFSQELPPELKARYSSLYSSAQLVADQSNAPGTYLMDQAAKDLWIATPLCVHRRCASPMFEIANQIAYDGLMVQGSSHSARHEKLGPSSWIHVSGIANPRQWVASQGEVLRELFRTILETDGPEADIFFITPFREVRAQLKAVISKECKIARLSKEQTRDLQRRIGTVHTFQGKEADIVVFVLGCDFQTESAANWAGARPNLVNVAVTRARNLLYVIGDETLWHNKGFFSDLHKLLPGSEWR